jgi:Flp pilus assembly pilin Flp
MKSFIARFVTDQSGAVEFDDGFTVFVMIIGFITALALLYATFVQLYAAVSGILPGYH